MECAAAAGVGIVLMCFIKMIMGESVIVRCQTCKTSWVSPVLVNPETSQVREPEREHDSRTPLMRNIEAIVLCCVFVCLSIMRLCGD